MSGLRDFLQDIDRRYPPNTDFGYIRYLDSENIKLTEENKSLRYENSTLKDEKERLRMDRDTLLSLITIPFIIKCNDVSNLPEGINIVYFMQEENTLCVKIGHSTGISSRRSNLQTGNPRELHLLGYVKGDKELEKEFHTTYRNFRIEGRREWYYNPPLRYSY